MAGRLGVFGISACWTYYTAWPPRPRTSVVDALHHCGWHFIGSQDTTCCRERYAVHSPIQSQRARVRRGISVIHQVARRAQRTSITGVAALVAISRVMGSGGQTFGWANRTTATILGIIPANRRAEPHFGKWGWTAVDR